MANFQEYIRRIGKRKALLLLLAIKLFNLVPDSCIFFLTAIVERLGLLHLAKKQGKITGRKLLISVILLTCASQ